MNTNTHAVVIGGSMAGLLAARVLADHFARVTIIERDRLPTGPHPQSRKGVPQASHVHVLLTRGLHIVESLFPGIGGELQRDGATPIQWGSEARTYNFAGWLPHFEGEPSGLLCSRDFLEFHVRRRALAYTNINTLQASDAIGLNADENGWVNRVSVHNRDDLLQAQAQDIDANLVVDASGRMSKLPDWLEGLGYDKPRETTVNSFLGYASRLYQPDADYASACQWKALLIRDRDAQHALGAGIYRIEDGLWQVNLGASGKLYPPTDAAGFLEFVRNLPVPDLYEALLHAQPISHINGYRRTENRWRHYERLGRMPHNAVALGDATCAFNPVYGQGMSIAALGAVTLGEMLTLHGLRHGFALRIQKPMAKVISTPWLMATGEDFRTPTTEGGQPSPLTRLTHRYFDRVLDVAVHEPAIHKRFQEVAQLLRPPSALFAPSVMLKALSFRAKPRDPLSDAHNVPDPSARFGLPDRDRGRKRDQGREIPKPTSNEVVHHVQDEPTTGVPA